MEKNELVGIVGIYVDDCLICENVLKTRVPRVPQAYEALRTSFKWSICGKNRFTMAPSTCSLQTANIILEQKEYTENLETVSVTHKRKRQPDDALTQYEPQQLRAGGQWLATQTRLNLAA